MQHESNIQILVHERKEVNEAAYDEVLKEEPGHINSYGDPAPWVIRSQDDGRVLASFQYKKQALRHLRRMDYYANQDQD